jgi:predicted RNA-binding Zn ribbon-like protein
MAGRAPSADTAPLIRALPDDLCLGFANTLCWRGRPQPAEQLFGIAELLDWLAGPGGMPAAAIARERLRARPAQAAKVFDAAISLREAIFRLFSALASGRTGSAEDLALLNRALAEAPERRRLARAGRGYAWEVGRAGLSAPALLAPVLWSAADLLVAGGRERVRQCANDQCLWLFLDQSKSGTRRWCDMGSCGNRAKARRHYERTKRADAAGAGR